MSGFLFIFESNKHPMCYEKLLGLSGCAKTYNPVNGVFIDKVTGITEQELSQLITSDYNQGYELFDDKLKQAWSLLCSDVIGMLRPSLTADTVIEGQRVGYPIGVDPIAQSALGTGNNVGIRLKLYNPTSFLSFYISSINIWAQTNQTVTLRVIDLSTRRQIDSFEVETNSETFIGKTYNSNRKDFDVALVYDSTVDTYKTYVKKGYCTDCGGKYNFVAINRLTQTSAVNLTLDGSFNATNIENIGFTYGMDLQYNITCNREAYMCSISNIFDYALAYYTSALIMEFAKHNSINSRVNTTVSVNVEELDARYNFYMEAYKTQLDQLVNNIVLPSDRDCFACKQNVKYVGFVAP